MVAMFDREILMQALTSECLTTVGSSAVIIGGHKVGKSFLLDHICSQQDGGVLFCRLDIDAIKAAARNGVLSDHAFLRVLVQTLFKAIDQTLTEQRPERATWEADLHAAEAKAAALASLGPDPALKVVYDKQTDLVKGCREKITEFDALSTVADSLRQLLVPGKDIQVDELNDVFLQLRGWRKRIVLLIDDYDRLVVEEKFTDNLFHFLRSDTFRRRFITLVSASGRLMDAAVDTGTRDRKSLFNHFQTQRLVPFRDHEPEQFLDWLAAQRDGGNVALTDDEKNYLISLGGGCPHLLRQARQRFIQHKRPSGESARTRFERDSGLVDEFHTVFQRIWSWSNAEEQSILRAIVDGTAVAPGSIDRLEAEGYVIADQDKLRPFSRLFGEFIRKKKAGDVPVRSTPPSVTAAAGLPTCSVEIPYTVFPSALLFAGGTRDAADVAIFHINNATGAAHRLQLSCEFPPYSTPAVLADDFAPGNRTETLAVDLKDDFRNQTSPVWTRVSYSVTVNPGAREEVLVRKSKRVRLLPKHYFLFARYDPDRDRLTDFSWLIAAWINAHDPSLQPVQAAATVLHAGLGHQRQKGEDSRAHAETKARALFDALKSSASVQYFDNAVVFHKNEDDYMQRVKTPAETLQSKNGNCLDGSVLFASLLAMCGLAPCILLIPGHALVGWKIPSSAEWEYLDTTMIADADYDAAVGEAARRVGLSAPIQPPGEIITDPKTFAIRIEVNDVVRQRHIVPL